MPQRTPFPPPLASAGRLGTPGAVTVDSSDNVYVADTDGDRLVLIASNDRAQQFVRHSAARRLRSGLHRWIALRGRPRDEQRCRIERVAPLGKTGTVLTTMAGAVISTIVTTPTR
jgi:hypothetical protein